MEAECRQEIRRGASDAPRFAGEMNFGVGNPSQETSWNISGTKATQLRL